MLIDVGKDRGKKTVGHVVIQITSNGGVVWVKVSNKSKKKWARVFLGSINGESLFSKMPFRDLAPRRAYTFKDIPPGVIKICCDDIHW